MDIINEVFEEIKQEILDTILIGDNPMEAARLLAKAHNMDASLANLLLKGIEEIFDDHSIDYDFVDTGIEK